MSKLQETLKDREGWRAAFRGVVTSLALHERLPEIIVVPREKTPTVAAARGKT